MSHKITDDQTFFMGARTLQVLYRRVRIKPFHFKLQDDQNNYY